MNPKTYKYNEWTLRRWHPKMHDKPTEGKILSEHATLKEARAGLTADSYIFNEQHRFTVLPQHFGIEPEATTLAAIERTEGEPIEPIAEEDTEIPE